MTWQDFFKSRVATWGLGIALLFVMAITAKVLIQKYQVDQEIAKLEKEVEKVKHDNNQLSSLVQYFSTPDYQDKAAREKLNLKKEGEVVVGLPQQSETTSGANAQSQNQSNFKRWFNYFFSSDASGRSSD